MWPPAGGPGAKESAQMKLRVYNLAVTLLSMTAIVEVLAAGRKVC